ncbi:MAG: 2-oxoacid:acceptor oxidoreductase family protein [Candidatus Marinimicrobia bacterium]|jgi:2-oxoglutarate ferredoxin oxidoreductase subunit gamma|nr:2-oxoacid:acceptor oxidoreductase family protein [Candidatus Neomarinimicrobiota bacterium]OQC48358.1 MAG: Pyruvate synthase subunit PorC [Candidatus Marinimicrobia bacterium ADurb.Bin030]MBP9005564.1 2-oxoacid:acceptor oxidoreductase family protein [Candidatus Neomarinimicrobiota bacterium]NLA21536.1 2-oxoacid:ferredoxin oxidoreductase subunit gamma [Candidatus Neomarinimicrobiota bacterium]HOD37631.1 2-oxoacid:acceptor oxidoreductase family protein [Candidatus Neomarinimicrobiota bacterium
MSFHYEIRLSGAGGQGLILVGKVLAEAAAIYDGLNATQSQSYGPEARGGASRSEVIISDGDIDYPKAENIDLLLALTQEACDKYIADLKPDGILIVDSQMVTKIPDGNFKVVALPIIQSAVERLGKFVVSNIIALGVIYKLAGIVSEDAIKNAIRARVPKGTEELNLKAFQTGIELAEGWLKEHAR